MSEFVERDFAMAVAGADGRWIEIVPASGGFRADPRFGGAENIEPVADNAEPEPAVASEPSDPLAEAYAQGHAAGHAEATAEAAARAEAEADAREKLALSFERLDARMEEELRLRLRDTVAALCEAAIAPLALDEKALLARIDRAVAMLARADDERLIRLNPEDIALVSKKLAADWQVLPDPALPRGAIRVESATGGVEDGPDQWRRAIAEAMDRC